MRRINKGAEPQSLTDWKAANPNSVYNDLGNPANVPTGALVRQDIRNACVLEQFYLCAYCCDGIDNDSSHNEHILCQANNSHLSLEFDNIIASCNASDSCGKYKDNNLIALTPLMIECEFEVRYNLNGRMRHSSQRGQNLNSYTNLNNRRLINRRARLIEALIYEQKTNPDELELFDDELLELMIENLAAPDVNNKLQPFSPVLIRILREYLEH